MSPTITRLLVFVLLASVFLGWSQPASASASQAAAPSASRLGALVGARTSTALAADTTRPTVSVSLSRNTIDPTLGETVRYYYSASESGYRQLEVVNSSGVVYSGPRAATTATGSVVWDGRNTAGAFVAPGAYVLQLYYEDTAGNDATSYPLKRKVHIVQTSASGPTSASTTKTPWSGYWWPQLSTYTMKLYNSPGPMTKYDRATGASSYTWEYSNHRTTNSANTWWGHCQAWSAAAIIEPQPYGATTGGVTFSQDDVEGLYTETWTNHNGWMYGTRYKNEGTSSAAYKDVHPADFDWLIRYWIGQLDTPVYMDFTTGEAVWNYPVYAYSRSSTWSAGKEYVTMKVTRPEPNYNVSGTSSVVKTFYYTLQSGTNGVWSNPSGSSVNTHPDYIVQVTGRSTNYGNPHVKPATLDAMFRSSSTVQAAYAPMFTMLSTESDSGSRLASASATMLSSDEVVAADSGSPATTAAPANNLGWRLGTRWTVRASEYASYLAESEWLSSDYRFEVVGADAARKRLTVAVRFADASLQPQAARGDLLRAGYAVVGGELRLAWLQPAGKGPRLSPAEARRVVGENFFSMAVPASPFLGGAAEEVDVPGIGATRGNRESLGVGESAVWAKGAPWWVSYQKGGSLSVELTDYQR